MVLSMDKNIFISDVNKSFSGKLYSIYTLEDTHKSFIDIIVDLERCEYINFMSCLGVLVLKREDGYHVKIEIDSFTRMVVNKKNRTICSGYGYPSFAKCFTDLTLRLLYVKIQPTKEYHARAISLELEEI